MTVSVCAPEKLGPDKCHTIASVRQGIACISLIGCLLIIAAIWVTRRHRNFGQRLILWLSLTAAVDTVPSLIGDVGAGRACQFQAFLMTWTQWATLCWVCCITHSLGFNLVKNRSSEPFERAYMGISWGMTLGISLVPAIADE